MAEQEKLGTVVKKRDSWTKLEIISLLENINELKDMLFPAFNSTVTQRSKLAAWDTVAERVNSASLEGGKTGSQSKKKWENDKKKYIAEWNEYVKLKNKTGGGVVPEPRGEVRTAIEIIGIDSPTLEGIDGGLETRVMQSESLKRPHDDLGSDDVQEKYPPSRKVMVTTQNSATRQPLKPVCVTANVAPSTSRVRVPGSQKTNVDDIEKLQLEVLKQQKENLFLEKEKLQLQIEYYRSRSNSSSQVRVVYDEPRVSCDESSVGHNENNVAYEVVGIAETTQQPNW